MKKFILLFMLFFTIGVTYAQDSTQYVTNSNAEKLIDKYSAKVENAIIALAEKLQQPAEHVYKILVKQQVVYGVSTLLFVVFSVIVVFWGFKIYHKNQDEFNGWDFFGMFLIVLGCIAFVISFIMFAGGGLSGLINPEYGALKDIVNMIK